MCIQPCDFNTTYQCKITNYNRTIVLNYSHIVHPCVYFVFHIVRFCLKSRNVGILGYVYVGVCVHIIWIICVACYNLNDMIYEDFVVGLSHFDYSSNSIINNIFLIYIIIYIIYSRKNVNRKLNHS